MTTGYYTDNNVSHTVMKAISRAGYPVSHIREFPNNKEKPGIFYGILRGAGAAMRYLQMRGIDYWYIDNGYFDAIYMDMNKKKDMGGKYRIVKNGLIDEFNGNPSKVESGIPKKAMLIPPSYYTAFMHDTTQEDWLYEWKIRLAELGCETYVRHKSDGGDFEKQVLENDAVVAFNSMAVIKAIELGKPVYTTHGIIRNADKFGKEIQWFDFGQIDKFYRGKQFTLEEIKEVGIAHVS